MHWNDVDPRILILVLLLFILLLLIFIIITILSVSTNQLVLSVCHRICIVSYTQVCIVS